jgi:uncharacterized protein involved in exopolysaccharide biosynthesis
MSKRHNQTEALFEVWRVLLKFRWRFVVPAFVVVALVLAGSMVLPRKYKAEAVFERRTDMVLSEIMSRGAPRSFQDPRESLTNEVIGDPALDQLLDQIMPVNPKSERSPFERAAFRADLKRKATVSYDIASNDLDRVRVTYVGDDPDMSRAVVNTLVRNHIERTRARIEDRLKQSAKFFSDEAANSREEIDALETRQLEFEIENAQLLPDSPVSSQGSLPDLQVRFTEAKSRRDAASAKIEKLRKVLDSTPQTTPLTIRGRNPELDRLDTQLRQLEAKYAELVGVYKMKAKHPDVLAVNEQIEGVKKVIVATETEVVIQKTETINPRYGEVETLIAHSLDELQAAERQADALKTQIDTLTAQSGSLFGVRSDHRKLARQIEDSQRELTFWQENLRRVEMALTAENDNKGVRLAFIKECDVIHKPVSPNLPQVLMAATLLGLIAGGISIFYAYRTDETFTDAQHLSRAFSLPTFGAVSEIITTKYRRLRRLRNLFLYPINGVVMTAVLIVLSGLLYLSLEKPHLFEELRRNPMRFIQERISGTEATDKKAVTRTALWDARNAAEQTID